MLEQRQIVFTILFGALFACVGLYGVVAFLMLAKEPGEALADRTLLYALGGVALVMTVVVIPMVRKQLMPPVRAQASLDEAPGSTEKESGPLGRLFTAQIVTWALCESIAIFGFVTVILYRDLRYYLAFALVAAFNFVVHRPSLELTKSVLRAERERV